MEKEVLPFPVTGEKHSLSSQMLFWVCQNILSFAKYKVTEIQREETVV